MKELFDLLNEIKTWCNDNAGFVGVVIFILTILIGIVTGFFKAILNKPHLKIESIPGPNICTVVDCHKKFDNHDVMRTALSVYLRVKNTGFTSTSIIKVYIKYRTNMLKWENLKIWKPISYLEKYIESIRIFYRFSKKIHQTTILDIFKSKLSEEKDKVYPLLFQHIDFISPSETFLERGQSTNGIVYFENEEYWGGYKPKIYQDEVKVIIIIQDTFNKLYKKRIKLPFLQLEEARKYNDKFGDTFLELDKKKNDNK